MQYRAAGDVQRFIVLQRNGVHHPFAGADVIHTGIVRIGYVLLRRVREQVQRLVHIVVEDDRILSRFGNLKADNAALHFRYNSRGGRQHRGAFHRMFQAGHFNFHPDFPAEVEIGHWGIGRNGVGVPDMLMVHHHVIYKELVPVHADGGGLRAFHGLRPLVDRQRVLRLPFSPGRAGRHQAQQRRQDGSQDSLSLHIMTFLLSFIGV